ncbi:MAG: J domain-containing protein [Haloarculaceae archaeon]
MLESLAHLPHWVVTGVELGVLASVLAAALFVAADRLFPTDHEPRTASGERRRRAELRAYLDEIDERYAEGHLVAGQRVAFYLPDRDVAITFDAHAYYRIERTATTAVLVEHEMPGRHLGTRLPFETPTLDDRGDPPQDPTVAAFAELGLSPTAGLEDVKRAYRKRVMEVHPDQGGDERAFQRVRQAYTTAKRRYQ